MQQSDEPKTTVVRASFVAGMALLTIAGTAFLTATLALVAHVLQCWPNCDPNQGPSQWVYAIVLGGLGILALAKG